MKGTTILGYKGHEKLDVGRAAPFASPIRFESLGLLHDPYTLPAGNPIDPQSTDFFSKASLLCIFFLEEFFLCFKISKAAQKSLNFFP